MMGLSKALSEFCLGLDANALPGPVVERLKAAVLDGFASMFAGVGEAVSAQTLSATLAAGGDAAGGCTIVGFGRHARVTDAALINGVIAHACDYDDSSWTMWGHPTAPLLPALLACTESRKSSGADLLVAFAAGLEVEKGLGMLMQPEHYRRGWHPTATLGLFGAVAGAGRLLGLSATEMQAAFGIAASMASGLRSNAGYSVKPLHAGLAARNGVEATLLAQAGITSNAHALEGEGGVFGLYGASHADRIEEIVGRLGRPFEIVDPGLSPKLYPCCSDIHCAIDIVLDEKAAHGFLPSDISGVRCFVGPMAEPNVRRRDPQTPTEARFSMSYCVASAIVRGRVGLEQFKPEALRNEDVRSVAARVTVGVDPGLAEAGTETFSSPSIVEIDLRDGRRLRTFLREMRGHPGRPLSDDDLRGKYLECAGSVLPAEDCKALLADICRLESLPDILGMMQLAAGRQLVTTVGGQ